MSDNAQFMLFLKDARLLEDVEVPGGIELQIDEEAGHVFVDSHSDDGFDQAMEAGGDFVQHLVDEGAASYVPIPG